MTGEQLEIVLDGDRHMLVDCAARLGEMAVTRAPNRVSWRITHVPTSFAVPYDFASASAAEHALYEIDKIVDWPGFVRALAGGTRPNTVPDVMAICTACGGLLFTGGLSGEYRRAELTRRLAEQEAPQ